MAHSILSPSSMHRWMNCPGSAMLCASQPRRESEAAEEGSAAHALAAMILRGELKIPAGKTPLHLVRQGDDFVLSPKPATKSGWPVTKEMLAAVHKYTTFVESWKGSKNIEVRLPIIADPAMFGTADAVVIGGSTMLVADFKYGVNSSVDVVDNPQLMAYACGALYELDTIESVTQVTMAIIQPRDRHNPEAIRVCTVDVEVLQDWFSRVLMPAALAASTEGAPTNPGEWCKWCEGSAVCPSMREKALEIAKADFADFRPQAPAEMTVADLAKVLNAASLLRDWVTAVEEYALEKLKAGHAVPGWKMVQKRANRKWRDDEVAHCALDPMLGEELYERKIKSPAAVEKLLKASGHIPEDAMRGLWITPDNGVTLAPETDKRKAVTTMEVEFEAAPDMSFLD